VSPTGPRQQKLADDYAAALERLGNRSARATGQALEASLNELLTDLRRFYAGFNDPQSPWTYEYSIGEATARYNTLVQQAQGFMPEERLAALQAVYQQDLAAAASLGAELSGKLIKLVDRAADTFAGASEAAVKAAAEITSAYIRGETMAFRNTLVQIVTRGASKGRGFRSIEMDIRKALQGATDPEGLTQRMGLKQRAELIARSELSNAYVRAQQETAREAGYDLVRWVATTDERTCMFCGSRHGKIYRREDVVAPAHPRCRCALVPAPEGSEEGDQDGEYWAKSREEIVAEIAKAKSQDLNKVSADLAKYLKKPTPSERRQFPGIEVAVLPVA
jgi:SPP1 gp7 family putative phage head morphogenesis protein